MIYFPLLSLINNIYIRRKKKSYLQMGCIHIYTTNHTKWRLITFTSLYSENPVFMEIFLCKIWPVLFFPFIYEKQQMQDDRTPNSTTTKLGYNIGDACMGHPGLMNARDYMEFTDFRLLTCWMELRHPLGRSQYCFSSLFAFLQLQ